MYPTSIGPDDTVRGDSSGIAHRDAHQNGVGLVFNRSLTVSREPSRLVSIAGRMALAFVAVLLVVAAIGFVAGLLLPSIARLSGP